VQVLKGAYSGTTYLGDNKNNPIITIFGSVFHNMAVAADGTVFTWGYNGYYELGDNTYIDKSTPIQPLTGAYNGTTYLGDNKNNPIVAVCANVYHNIALAADGSVYTWGYNGWGNLGDGTTNDGKIPLQVLNGVYSGTSYLGDNSNNPMIGVSVGKYHSMALAANGTVYTWGWNPYGQLGDNTTTDKSTPEIVLKGDYSGSIYLGDNTNNPIISVSGGTYHSSAMAVNGTLYTWGYNGYGQLGDSTKTSQSTPVKVLKGDYNGTRYLNVGLLRR
jgi:alpha-tubulin suppressor-like RCC1 family protein